MNTIYVYIYILNIYRYILYTYTMHMLPKISRSKGNQAMKFDQLIKYNNRNVFLENHAENEARRPAPDLFLFFKKTLYEVKASGL